MDVAGRGNVRVTSTSLYINEYCISPAKVAVIVREYLSGFVWCGFLIGRIASMKYSELLSVFRLDCLRVCFRSNLVR